MIDVALLYSIIRLNHNFGYQASCLAILSTYNGPIIGSVLRDRETIHNCNWIFVIGMTPIVVIRRRAHVIMNPGTTPAFFLQAHKMLRCWTRISHIASVFQSF